MKKNELQQIIKEEIRKVLNEGYRSPEENLDVLLAMLAKGKKTLAMEVIADVQDMVQNGKSMEESFDEAIEMAMENGFRYQPVNYRPEN